MASRRPRETTELNPADENVKVTKIKEEGLKGHSKGRGCGVHEGRGHESIYMTRYSMTKTAGRTSTCVHDVPRE